MDNSKIIDKIKKCLALATSDNPNEASTALRQAHALMEKYGITTKDAKMSEIVMEEVASVHTSQLPAWAVNLVTSCALAFECKVTFTSAGKNPKYRVSTYPVGYYSFFGTVDNVDLATYAYEQLSRAHTTARAHFERQVQYLDTTAKRAELKSFSTGWAQAVKRSIDEFARSFKETAQYALIEDVIKSRSPSIKEKPAVKSKLTAQGYYSGVEEGEKVQIRTGLGAREGQMRLASK